MRVLLGLSFVLFWLGAAPAWATQPHFPPEGLYVHLLAHVIFGGALLVLFYWSRKLPYEKTPAWFYLRLTFFFFLLWNFDALAVHLLETHLSLNTYYYSASFEGKIPAPVSWKHFLYYLLRFDHVFCVPAMYSLWQSLRCFARQKYASC